MDLRLARAGLIAYDCPPEGFLIASRSGVLAPNLIATLYARR